MSLRVRQGLVILVGVVAAAVMLGLGLWQMQVFVDQGNRSAAARAAQAPVQLLEFVHPDGSVGDVYGKRVIAEGTYVPNQTAELVYGPTGTIRVVGALALDDGRVLPVVRGTLAPSQASPADPTPVPAGRVTQVGVFLPSEPGADHQLPAGYRLGALRLPLLAQLWPQQLTPGFITVDADASAAQGLLPAEVRLPSEDGSWRNSGYAVQWWVFAAFALGMAGIIARSLGRRERAARDAAQDSGRADLPG